MKKVTLWSLIITAGLFVLNFISGHLFDYIFTLNVFDDLRYNHTDIYGSYHYGLGVSFKEAHTLSYSGKFYPAEVSVDFVTLITTFILLFLVGTFIHLIIKHPKMIGVYSLVITAVLFVSNLLLSIFCDHNFCPIPLDFDGSLGFGVRLKKYPMVLDLGWSADSEVSFDPITLILTFVFFFGFALLVHLTAIGLKKMKSGTICSLIITAGLFVLNFLSGVLFDFSLGIPVTCEKIVRFVGFGVYHSEIPPLAPPEYPAYNRAPTTYPEFVSLMLTYAIVLGIAALICRCKKHKAENEGT